MFVLLIASGTVVAPAANRNVWENLGFVRIWGGLFGDFLRALGRCELIAVRKGVMRESDVKA